MESLKTRWLCEFAVRYHGKSLCHSKLPKNSAINTSYKKAPKRSRSLRFGVSVILMPVPQMPKTGLINIGVRWFFLHLLADRRSLSASVDIPILSLRESSCSSSHCRSYFSDSTMDHGRGN